MTASARLWIVRHGNTFAPGETPRRVGARTDLPLVETGRAQARAAGDALRAQGVAFTRALCSPLRRTRETAALILDAMGDARPAVEGATWLAEIDHGPDEDRPEAEVVARIGGAALAAWETEAVPPPGWTVDAEARRAAWSALLADPPPGDTLLVTSNGAARFALLAHPALHRATPTLKLRTGAWGTIAIDPTGPRLLAWDVRA